MANSKRTKGQTTIYKALHNNLVIQQHEPTKNRGVGVDSDAPEGKAVPAPHTRCVILVTNR
jgi:hypothetical protein